MHEPVAEGCLGHFAVFYAKWEYIDSSVNIFPPRSSIPLVGRATTGVFKSLLLRHVPLNASSALVPEGDSESAEVVEDGL